MAKKNVARNIILALDTSVSHCSVSLLQDEVLLAEKSNVMQKGQSEKLFNFIQCIFSEANLTLKDVKAIGVGVGPGNFTGLRIGISAAKGLAMALKIKVFGVNRFETLIETNQPTLALVATTEKSFYTQFFINKKPIKPPTESTRSEILKKNYLPNTIISGDSAIQIAKKLNLQHGANDSTPKTEKIGLIAQRHLETGGPSPAPLYIKGPDAKLPKEPIPLILGSNVQ